MDAVVGPMKKKESTDPNTTEGGLEQNTMLRNFLSKWRKGAAAPANDHENEGDEAEPAPSADFQIRPELLPEKSKISEYLGESGNSVQDFQEIHQEGGLSRLIVRKLVAGIKFYDKWPGRLEPDPTWEVVSSEEE
jgi:hypothetical protein